MNKEIDGFIHLFNQISGIDLSIYDQSFTAKTIRDRLLATSYETIDSYSLYLANSSDEASLLKSLFNNSYSEFFRNPLTFAYLEQILLPLIIERKRVNHESEIRIWSAACASGQEAYSLAILCSELTARRNESIKCRIFATDISSYEISNAQKGIYQSASVSKVTLNRIHHYFTRKDDSFTIIPELREQIDFSVFDLLSEQASCPPASIYGNFDLVFCGNLLFYYKPNYRKLILDKIGHSLNLGGYILTGEAERDIIKGNYYREVFPNSCIFQKK
jgi:chemotaxis protein methyltransferase CheR